MNKCKCGAEAAISIDAPAGAHHFCAECAEAIRKALRPAREGLSSPLLPAIYTADAEYWLEFIKARVTILPETGCHQWNGKKVNDGYPNTTTGRYGFPRRSLAMHRVAWAAANGVDPGQYVIRHKCDNRWCVNPAHLEPGTHSQNTQDILERNQRFKGLRGRRDAVARLWRKGYKTTQIARELGCAAGVITNDLMTLGGQGEIDYEPHKRVKDAKAQAAALWAAGYTTWQIAHKLDVPHGTIRHRIKTQLDAGELGPRGAAAQPALIT